MNEGRILRARGVCAYLILVAITATLLSSCRSEQPPPAPVDPDPTEVVKYAGRIVNMDAAPPLFDAWVGPAHSRVVEGFHNDGSQYSWKVAATVGTISAPATDTWTFVNGAGRARTSETAPAVHASSPASDRADAPVSPQNGSRVAGNKVEFSWPPVAGATNYNLTVWNSSSDRFGDVIARYRYLHDVRWRQAVRPGESLVTIEGALDLDEVKSFCQRDPSSDGSDTGFSLQGIARMTVEIQWKVVGEDATYLGAQVRVHKAAGNAAATPGVTIDPRRFYENKPAVAYCIAADTAVKSH